MMSELLLEQLCDLGWAPKSTAEGGKCTFGCIECAWHLSKTALLWAERNFKHPAASFSSGAWFLSAQAQSGSWPEARSPPPPQKNPETTRLDPQHVYTSLLMCLCHYPAQLCGLRGSTFILAARLVQCLRWERDHFLLEINFNDGLIPINNTRHDRSLMSGLKRHGSWTRKSSLSAQVTAGDPFRYV